MAMKIKTDMDSPTDSGEDYLEDEDFNDENDFQYCADCDLPDACADFGCAIKLEVKKAPFDY